MTKNRPYKEALPKKTVLKVQNILNEIELLVLPVYWGNPYNEIFSVRVEATDEDGGFGANGKGRNQIFALASAYAEIIERIQNQLISGVGGFNKAILNAIYNQTGFYYYPDEKTMRKEELLNLPAIIKDDILPAKSKIEFTELADSIYSRQQIIDNGGIASVPFYSISQNEKIYLPYNFLYSITGSNGMASGNTVAEATFQAMCEIYERKSASLIYYDRLTPPTINKEYLSNYKEEFAIITEIENRGFEVIVKDFSCNIELPVIGLIVIDKENKKYRLNVGSDTSFRVALSRTLTEIYQGARDENDIKKILMDFPNEKDTPYFFGNKSDNGYEAELNLKKFMINGKGYFPPSLFNSDYSYSFNSEVFNEKASYEEEVKHLFKIAKKLDYKVYIRDVSFLGFPTVYIYIPKVSILGRKDVYSPNKSSANITIFDDLENLIFPFDNFLNDVTKIKKAIKIIGLLNTTMQKFTVKDILHLSFTKETKWDNLPVSFFVSLLYFLTKDYKNSIKYLKAFLKDEGLETDEYYNEILSYFRLLKNGKSLDNVDKKMIDDFKDYKSLFKYIGYPNCPNCLKCLLKDDCRTKINMKKVMKINEKSKETILNQNKFGIFS